MSAQAPRDLVGVLRARARMVAAFARRDIATRYAGSYLGIVWAFAMPLLSSAVYVLVFGMLMQGALLGERYRRFDFTTFYFLGFAPWLLFSEVASRATSVVRENRNLVRNVRFEHHLLPLVLFVSGSVSHAVVLLLGVALALVNGYGASPNLYLLPFFFMVLFFFSVGVAYVLAALSVYLPDLGQIVPIFLSLYFFACPILYTPQLVEQSAGPFARAVLLDMNPMARIVEGYRMSLLDIAPSLGAWGMVSMTLGSLAMFAVGIAVYRYLQKGFADIL